MPTFSGGQGGTFTPSTSADNWTLDAQAAAGVFGRVTEFSWGGRLTTSTGYRTRWTRASTLGVTPGTAIVLAPGNPNYTTAGCALIPSYTTPPVLPADPGANLHAQDWNGQGGVGYIVLPLAQPWWVLGNGGVNKQEINCRNVAGVDANGSSYGVTWMED